MFSLVTSLVLAFAAAAPAQVVMEMTPELVRAAINDEKGKACYDVRAGGFLGSHLGCFTTPYSRVVQAARAARSKYKSFSEADVTSDLIAPEVHIYAWPPDRPGPQPQPGKVNVDAMVLMPAKSKDRSLAIQPTLAGEITMEYKNLLGATFEGRGMRAVFPLSALTNGYELRIVYDSDYWDKGCVSVGTATDCPAQLKLDKVR